ncbi:MAG: hypothetical protein ACYCPT_12965 [Acidimicrobiales bacterium]
MEKSVLIGIIIAVIILIIAVGAGFTMTSSTTTTTGGGSNKNTGGSGTGSGSGSGTGSGTGSGSGSNKNKTPTVNNTAPSTFYELDNMTLIDNRVPIAGTSYPPSITYYQSTPDAHTCGELCKADTTCNGYTWVDTNAKNGKYAGGCYGITDDTWYTGLNPQTHYYSGINKTVNLSEVPATTTDPTIIVLPTGITAINSRITGPKLSNAWSKYYASGTNAASCQAACIADQPFCSAYTWQDSTQGAYANQCYGINNTYNLEKQSGCTTGLIL